MPTSPWTEGTRPSTPAVGRWPLSASLALLGLAGLVALVSVAGLRPRELRQHWVPPPTPAVSHAPPAPSTGLVVETSQSLAEAATAANPSDHAPAPAAPVSPLLGERTASDTPGFQPTPAYSVPDPTEGQWVVDDEGADDASSDREPRDDLSP